MKERRNYQSRPERDTEEILEPHVEESKKLTGVITGCDLLNVRKEPNASSAVVAVLSHSDQVLVQEENGVSDYFKVTLQNGVSGYCMKNYISAEQ